MILTWLTSNLIHTKMIDCVFFVGIIVTIIIRFFTSSGGYFTNSLNAITQSQTGVKVSGEGISPYTVTHKSFSFLVSLVFTIGALIATIIYYWKEF